MAEIFGIHYNPNILTVMGTYDAWASEGSTEGPAIPPPMPIESLPDE